MVLVGVTRSRTDEGLKADYFEFYENLKAARVRANMGKIGDTGLQTTRHVVQFVFSGGKAYSYSINGTSVNFKNGSYISKVVAGGTTWTTGTISVSFIPDTLNYTGPTPIGGSFISRNSANPGAISSAIIYLARSGSAMTYTITLYGTGYSITRVERQ